VQADVEGIENGEEVKEDQDNGGRQDEQIALQGFPYASRLATREQAYTELDIPL
jgi:hypothetical protein